MSVDVKIGIENTARELNLTSADSAEEVHSAISAALAGEVAVLSLTDEKGSRFVVPAGKISYAEVGTGDSRRVGFGS